MGLFTTILAIFGGLSLLMTLVIIAGGVLGRSAVDTFAEEMGNDLEPESVKKGHEDEQTNRSNAG